MQALISATTAGSNTRLVKGGDLPTQAQFDELLGILWGLITSLQNLTTKVECLATTVKNLATDEQAAAFLFKLPSYAVMYR
jgi:hypothetical protein